MEASPDKTCSRCMIAKPVEDFSRDQTRADGLAYRCRLCAVAVNRENFERRELAAGRIPGAAAPRTGRQPAEPGGKACGSCKLHRPDWLFYRDSRRADGLSWMCRYCEAERTARRSEARKGAKPARLPKSTSVSKPPAANARHGRRPAAPVPKTPEAAAKLAAKAAERAEKAAAREAAAKVIMAVVAERAAQQTAAWEARRREPPSDAAQARVRALLAAVEANKAATLPSQPRHPAG